MLDDSRTPFGDYILQERIGIGGMAEIFLATAQGIEGFERRLVIKRILPDLQDESHFVSLLVEEAKLCVGLDHPNIVQVYDLGRIDGQYFIAMEYVDGRDLLKTLAACGRQKVGFPTSIALYILMEVLKGLDYVHRLTKDGQPLGIIHRDVSPSNILLSFQGEVKLGDFGIAKARTRGRDPTGILTGKFGYMAPEQVAGHPIDHRVDVFAVGILLYELLTGRRLFSGPDHHKVLERVRRADVNPAARHYRPDLDFELEFIIMRALAREPRQRFSNCAELHDALQTYVARSSESVGPAELGHFIQTLFSAPAAAEQDADSPAAFEDGPSTAGGILPMETSVEISGAADAAAEPEPDPELYGNVEVDFSLSAQEVAAALSVLEPPASVSEVKPDADDSSADAYRGSEPSAEAQAEQRREGDASSDAPSNAAAMNIGPAEPTGVELEPKVDDDSDEPAFDATTSDAFESKTDASSSEAGPEPSISEPAVGVEPAAAAVETSFELPSPETTIKADASLATVRPLMLGISDPEAAHSVAPGLSREPYDFESEAEVSDQSLLVFTYENTPDDEDDTALGSAESLLRKLGSRPSGEGSGRPSFEPVEVSGFDPIATSNFELADSSAGPADGLVSDTPAEAQANGSAAEPIAGTDELATALAMGANVPFVDPSLLTASLPDELAGRGVWLPVRPIRNVAEGNAEEVDVAGMNVALRSSGPDAAAVGAEALRSLVGRKGRIRERNRAQPSRDDVDLASAQLESEERSSSFAQPRSREAFDVRATMQIAESSGGPPPLQFLRSHPQRRMILALTAGAALLMPVALYFLVQGATATFELACRAAFEDVGSVERAPAKTTTGRVLSVVEDESSDQPADSSPMTVADPAQPVSVDPDDTQARPASDVESNGEPEPDR